MKTVLWIIVGVMSAVMIAGVVIVIYNVVELIHLNRAQRSFEQFHAKTEQMIYDHCIKNNMTRDQFFDRMSKSLKEKEYETQNK